MPETDLDLLIDAAREAGAVALAYHGNDLTVRHKADEAGPVTAADLAVNRVLQRRLRAARPDYGWLSEESPDDGARLSARRVFIVDPIDGTRSFISGQDIWAHALAVVEDGVPVAGVVYLPGRDRLYAAARGAGAALNGAPLAVTPRAALEGAGVLTTKPNLDPGFWRAAPPAFDRHHRPSLAYRMSLVAQGRFDAMFTFRPSWEWDIAAGALILSEAGATVTDRRGAALRFNNAVPQTDGVIAGGPGIHADILSRLRPL